MGKKQFFYGWVIVAVSCLVMFVNYGLANGPLGLYLVSTTQSLGISRTEFSLLYTFRSATMMVFNLFFGVLSQKIGLRRMVFLGCCGIALAMAIFSFAGSGVFFYIGGLFLGLGFAMSSTGALSTLCRNWFYSHRGLFTGIILAASGLGSSLGSHLVTAWIENLSWRGSFRVSAAAIAVVALVAVLLIRDSPESKNTVPYGSASDVKAKVRGEGGVTFRQAIRRPEFYIVMACMVCIGMLTNPVYTNVSPQIVDAGLGADLASQVISILFIVLAVAKIVLGQLYDFFGFKRTLCLCFGANIAGILILLLANGAAWYYVFAVVFAVSVPLETVMMPFFVSTVFGEKQSPVFLGIALALNSLGLGLGNPIMSAFYDINGNYRQALIVFLVLSIAVFALLAFFTSKKHTLVHILCEQDAETTE